MVALTGPRADREIDRDRRDTDRDGNERRLGDDRQQRYSGSRAADDGSTEELEAPAVFRTALRAAMFQAVALHLAILRDWGASQGREAVASAD